MRCARRSTIARTAGPGPTPIRPRTVSSPEIEPVPDPSRRSATGARRQASRARRPASLGPSALWPQGDDDVALLVTGVDVPVGLDDLFERITAIDDGLVFA